MTLQEAERRRQQSKRDREAEQSGFIVQRMVRLMRLLARYRQAHHQRGQWPDHHAIKPTQDRHHDCQSCPLARIPLSRCSVRWHAAKR